MDPMTMLAIASAAVGGASTVYNMFAGQSQINQARMENLQRQGLITSGYRNSMNNLALQTADQREGVVQSTGRLGASMAGAGVLGPQAGAVSESAGAQGGNAVDMSYSDKSTQLGIQYTEQMDQLKDGMGNLNMKSTQLGLDGLAGMAGIGLSAGAAMVKGGLFSGGAVPGASYAGNGVMDYQNFGSNGPYGSAGDSNPWGYLNL